MNRQAGVAGICIPVRILGPFVALVDYAGGPTRIGDEELASSLMGGSWSPDGRLIAFVLEEDGNRTIVLVDARSHKLARLGV